MMYKLLLRAVMNSHPGCLGHNWPFLLPRLFDQNCCLRTFCSKLSPKNHYEVMGLEKTCSQSDIKDAFLRLSKELHPDMQPSSQSGQQHSKFICLNAAYSALNKPHSRRLYDAALVAQFHRQQAKHMDGVTTDKQYGRVIYPDPNFWAYRNAGKGSTHNGRAYQGLRWSDSTVVTGIIVFMLIGMVVRYILAKTTMDYDQRLLKARNSSIALSLHETQERARANDRMAQIRVFMDEIIAEDALAPPDAFKEVDRNQRLLQLLANGPPAGKET